MEGLEVGKGVLRGCCPVSFDIGGSMTKIVHAVEEENKTVLHLTSYPGGDFKELVERLKSILSDTVEDDNGPIYIYATGIGSNLYKKRLESEMNVRCHILCEWDCFLKSLLFVGKYLPLDDVYYTISEDLSTFLKENCKDMQSLVESRLPYTETRYRVLHNPEEVLEPVPSDQSTELGHIKLPCILAMCGSAFVLLKINEDESCQFLDYSNFGGLYFNVLGRLVTGSQDYGALLEQSGECDGSSADLSTKELRDDSVELDWYSLLPSNSVGFPLGKVLQKPRDEIKDGDILHSLLGLLCDNMAQVVQLNAASLAVKNVYFCGNFILSDNVRKMLARSLFHRRFSRPKNEWVNLRFVKNGGFFGALGSLILSKDSMTK